MKTKLQARIRVLIAVVVLFGLTAPDRPVRAEDKPQAAPQTQDNEVVYRAAYAALNAGDLEGNLKYYADDAITIALPPPPGVDAVASGKQAIRAWTVTFLESHPHIEFTDFHVNGETITARTLATDDFLKSSGVGYLQFSGTAIVRDGLIVSETYLMDKESLDRLTIASTLQANKALVGRFYDEIFNKGDMAVADKIIAPDFIDRFSGQNGIAHFKETIKLFRTSFPDIKLEYTDVVAEGNMVVVNITGSGTYRGGMKDIFGIPDSAIGKKVTWHGTDYARIVDGKIVEGWGTHDDLGWLQQFGLKLAPASQ
ncbi:MAG: ester cyclase [Caldilineaceae bacterium]